MSEHDDEKGGGEHHWMPRIAKAFLTATLFIEATVLMWVIGLRMLTAHHSTFQPGTPTEALHNQAAFEWHIYVAAAAGLLLMFFLFLKRSTVSWWATLVAWGINLSVFVWLMPAQGWPFYSVLGMSVAFLALWCAPPTRTIYARSIDAPG